MQQRIEISSPESKLKNVYYKSNAVRRVWNFRPKIFAETLDGQICEQVGRSQKGKNLEQALSALKRNGKRQKLFKDLAFIVDNSGNIIEQKETNGSRRIEIVGIWEIKSTEIQPTYSQVPLSPKDSDHF